jgi:hypothetical protein
MTHPQEVVEGAGKTAPSTAITGVNGFQLEPRCRVCRNDQVRKKVNDLLASGASYAYIVRALGEDNANLDGRDRITVDSVRNHTARHFPVQNVARATYREILERRAKENAVDFVEGVATAITPMAFLETLMVKGYETLVDPETKVDVNTGMIAACRLQSLIDSRAGQPDIADMMAKVNRIIAAIKSTVPESLWPEIMRKIDGEDAPGQPQDHQSGDLDAADEEYDPLESAEVDDDDL